MKLTMFCSEKFNFKKKDLLLLAHFLKSLLNFFTILFILWFWFFGHETSGIWLPARVLSHNPLHWKIKC